MVHAGSLHGTHDLFLVALSILIAVLASYTALDLAERSHGAAARGRALWFCAAAVALGGGIWSMHFIAMLAFDIGRPIRYHVGLTLASLLAAVAVTGAGLYIVNRWPARRASLIVAGLFTGCGVATMHYMGMAAMRMNAAISYEPTLVAASIGIAIVAATAALWLAANVKATWHRMAAALVMAAAIAGMHYTGMAAAAFTAGPSAAPLQAPGAAPHELAAIISGASIAIFGLGLIAALIDRRFADQAQREANVRHSEQQFRTLVSNIPGVCYRCRIDADYTIEFVSDAIEALTGYPAGDFVGNRLRTLVSTYHPDDLPMVHEASDRSVANRQPFTVDFRIIHRDGSIRWAHETGRAVFDDEGRAVYLDGVIFDITELKQIQRTRDESEARKGAILRASMDAIISMDHEGRILDFNPAAEAIFGHRAEDVTGRELAEAIIPPALRDAHRRGMERYLRTGETTVLGKRIEVTAMRRDGSEFPVELTIASARFAGQPAFIGFLRDITERRRIENELRASEQKFKSLLTNIPGAFYRSIVDEPYTMAYVSDAIELITGYPAADFMDSRVRNFSSIAHPDDAAMVQQALANALKTHQPFSVEYRIQHRDGSYRWIHERGQGVYEEDGKLRYLDGAVFDITESHKIREELLASEQKFKTLLGNIPGVFYRCANDADYTMEFISPAISGVSGYPPDDFIGNKVRSYASLIHPDDVELVNDAVNAGLARHEPFTIEYRIVHRDGMFHWVHEKGQGIYDINGKLLHLDGAIFDITEQHRIEEALQQTQRRLSDAIESISEGFVLWDAEDRLIVCNSKYREFFAASADLMVPGRTLEEIVRAAVARGQYPDAESDPEGWIQERIRRHREAAASFELKLADGRWLRISDRRTADGGTVGIRADITVRKNIELQLREANESLRRAMDRLAQQEKLATIGQVAATVSHELRNPLGAIRNSMALVRQITSDKKLGVERALDRVDRNIERCTSIISDLLEFTRRKELNREPTAIDAWLAATLASHALPADVVLERDLRSNDEVAVDREKFRQAIINLVDNAAQALKDPAWQPPEGHRRRIILRTETAGPHVRVSVIDSGPGIPAEVLERIFEPLFTTKSFGVGLGLPTVRQIVEQHGGTIDVESRINEGSSFVIWLPRQGEAVPQPGEATGREAAA